MTEQPKRTRGRPRKPAKPKLAPHRPPKSDADLRRDAYMAMAVKEFRKDGLTVKEARQIVSETMAGHRGFMAREDLHRGVKKPPSPAAVEARTKRLRRSQRGREALHAIIAPSPDIRALPEGRARAEAMLRKLLDHYHEPTWTDAFKAPPMFVSRFNVPAPPEN